MSSTTICRFFQRGACSYGSQCKFIHPGQPTRGGNGGTASSFAGATQGKNDGYLPATIDSVSIDIAEKPIWILSSYGPGKNPPCQLIDGRDISFEEARMMAYQSQAEGNPAAYEQEWIRLNTEAETQLRNILSDLPGAINFLSRSQENRANVYKYKQPNGDLAGPTDSFSSQSQQAQNVNPFGSPSPAAQGNHFGQPAQPAFGQPAFGQPAFGQSAFGQPSQPTSAFTPSSPFGATPTSQPAFGQPAFGQPAFGQTSAPTNAFGKPAQPAFGQPAFGQPSAPQSAFGQPSALGQTSTTSAFGKPAFGQPAFGQSAFGQPQQQQPVSAFGTPTPAPNPFGGAPAAQPAFGQPAFGQSAFGQPAPLGSSAPSPFAAAAAATQSPAAVPSSPFNAFAQQQPAAAANPFGQPQQPASINPFGQPAQQQNTGSPFTQENPFQKSQQAPSTAPNPFGQASTPAANPFGQPAAAAAPTPVANAFSNAQPQNAGTSPFSSQNAFQSSSQPPAAVAVAANTAGAAAASAAPKNTWDDLVVQYTPQECEAFKAKSFTFGMVPLVAPPRELCI